MRHLVKAVALASLLIASALYLAGRSTHIRGGAPTTPRIPPTRHVWLTFTKAGANSPLGLKLEAMLDSMMMHSRDVVLHLNVISDVTSRDAARLLIDRLLSLHYPSTSSQSPENLKPTPTYSMYDVEECARNLSDIVQCMTPHFSSKPGSYYSDALFYLSLGLHRIAPEDQTQIISLDCDLRFKSSIELLFKEFDKFSSTNLYGLGYELSPVYRHVLYNYRTKHKNTRFGSEPHFSKGNAADTSNLASNRSNGVNGADAETEGFPGFNSGVILLNLERLRRSKTFANLLKCDVVRNLTKTYSFKGHLGDQDFFTLLGYEKPELFHTLDCGFNRQLCKWWRQYVDVKIFDDYFKCDESVKILHGNCNTAIAQNENYVLKV
ncbi:xyloside xylosyltransferase [Arctopsyche grandis]|uniref:xyloside xylosyltransferase n=1 Tax=Arctopsyche grandis TaxID=121162 RepID=UPI00406D9FA4